MVEAVLMSPSHFMMIKDTGFYHDDSPSISHILYADDFEVCIPLGTSWEFSQVHLFADFILDSILNLSQNCSLFS